LRFIQTVILLADLIAMSQAIAPAVLKLF